MGPSAGETILNTVADHLSLVSCRGNLKKLWNEGMYLNVDALWFITFGRKTTWAPIPTRAYDPRQGEWGLRGLWEVCVRRARHRPDKQAMNTHTGCAACRAQCPALGRATPPASFLLRIQASKVCLQISQRATWPSSSPQTSLFLLLLFYETRCLLMQV